MFGDIVLGESVFAFVVGGSRGIGRATVLLLAERGYSVGLSYVKAGGEASRVVEEALGRGASDSFAIRLDASSWSDVVDAVNVVSARFPFLNILVYSAGVLQVGSVEELDPGEWDRVIGVNLSGAFYVVKGFLPLLKRAPWASIVFVSSIAGQTGNVYAGTAYAASKAGLIGLTKRLAVELAGYGIRVNAVAPSFVETDMTRRFLEDPESRRRIMELHPLRMILKPVDVARAILYLAEPASNGVTGHVLSINAGRYT